VVVMKVATVNVFVLVVVVLVDAVEVVVVADTVVAVVVVVGLGVVHPSSSTTLADVALPFGFRAYTSS